jgi:predicted nucleic acid-binding protein
VLRRLVATGIMDPGRGAAALEILQDLPVHRHPENPLLPRIWQLCQNLTAYAAAYVALAEALGCPLLTFDAGLSRVPGLHVRIMPEEA